MSRKPHDSLGLIGIGLYTPAEAERLVGVRAQRIVRWLRGSVAHGRHYERLWRSQIDLGDGRVYLGFGDLMEVRVADAFIRAGLSPQKVRRAIEKGREIIGEERPLSTVRFRTDGRSIFLHVLEEEGTHTMIDVLKSQYAFRDFIEPSLKNIEFDEAGVPVRWWPRGKAARIVIDPARSLGQPIEAESCVPVAILAAAARAEGSTERAARVWGVSTASMRRAIAFQADVDQRIAA